MERIGKLEPRVLRADGRKYSSIGSTSRKRKLKEVKMSALGAVREGRKETAKDLMQAYYRGVDKKSRV